ncbi:MAG: hypothetical protein ACLSTJ_07695 [Clostridium neonatale]
MSIYDMLKNLIDNKYYDNKEEIIERLNVFLAYKVITVEQYQELMELTESKYTE